MSLLFSLPELFNSYKTWVTKNPQTAGEYETLVKWVSYFIAGRINNSHVVSELVYCLSNLLVLFNDGIIRRNLEFKVKTNVEKLKLWLAVIEYSEVFCELSVQKLWGNTGKWIIIVAIQVFKCVVRLLLIYKHKEATVENPIISPLERAKLSKDDNRNSINGVDLSQSELKCTSFTLKRSGRLVRKVESSPPLGLRNWKPLELQQVPKANNDNRSESILIKRQLIAETIYVTKPMVHLITMGLFGSKTWKPWIISLAMDLSSLQLYRSTEMKTFNSLSKQQKLQLSKRTVVLLLYLIRSPFYERHSQNKINSLLVALSNNIPLMRVICHPLMQYLPFWQSSYFYMWSA